MNILILSWRGPGHPNAGGAEISTYEHAKRWVEKGHNVTLFTSYYRGVKVYEVIDGINIMRYGSQFLGVQWKAFEWYKFTNHPKFDLVIDQFHGLPFFTPLYIKEKKLAFIHEVAKEVWKFNQFPVPLNFLVTIVGTILEPFIFKIYRNIHFMTVSESTKKDLLKWGISPDNVTIIHNGVKVPAFEKFPRKEKKKTLIYLGALAKDKGIEDALRTFSILASISLNWQFWVVGRANPRYLSKLKSQSERLQLKGKIKFWGYISEQKKFELLERAHILINPSVREGWGLVVIEAASVGTPALAFDVPGLRDSIIDGKTGVLCRSDSAEQLAKEILDLLKDTKEYEKMCNNAFLWSKNFSWNKAGRESLKLIEELVGKT